MKWIQSKTQKGLKIASGEKYVYAYQNEIKGLLVDSKNIRVVLPVKDFTTAKQIAELLEA